MGLLWIETIVVGLSPGECCADVSILSPACRHVKQNAASDSPSSDDIYIAFEVGCHMIHRHLQYYTVVAVAFSHSSAGKPG